MVKDPGSYRWSSYQTNAGDRKNPLVTEHQIFQQLGDCAELRNKAYRELFCHQLDNKILQQIRETLNGEYVWGRKSFRDHVGELINRPVSPGKAGRLLGD